MEFDRDAYAEWLENEEKENADNKKVDSDQNPDDY